MMRFDALTDGDKEFIRTASDNVLRSELVHGIEMADEDYCEAIAKELLQRNVFAAKTPSADAQHAGERSEHDGK